MDKIIPRIVYIYFTDMHYFKQSVLLNVRLAWIALPLTHG